MPPISGNEFAGINIYLFYALAQESQGFTFGAIMDQRAFSGARWTIDGISKKWYRRPGSEHSPPIQWFVDILTACGHMEPGCSQGVSAPLGLT